MGPRSRGLECISSSSKCNNEMAEMASDGEFVLGGRVITAQEYQEWQQLERPSSSSGDEAPTTAHPAMRRGVTLANMVHRFAEGIGQTSAGYQRRCEITTRKNVKRRARKLAMQDVDLVNLFAVPATWASHSGCFGLE